MLGPPACRTSAEGFGLTRRVALIGYGDAGANYHGPLIDAEPRLELAAIVTGDERRRARALRDRPHAEVVATVDQLWPRADEFDLAVVAAPVDAHVPLALAALEHGLAVVVEKPMAPAAQEALELVESARRRHALLTVFQNRRWDRTILTIRSLLDEGALGHVLRYEARFERWAPEAGAGHGDGLLYDFGSHLVDQALHLFGPVQHVYAEVDAHAGGADDDTFLALTHTSGVRSHLAFTNFAGQRGPRTRVLGDRAAYVRQLGDGAPPGRDPSVPFWEQEEPEEQRGMLGTDGDLQPVPSAACGWPSFYAGVAAALHDGAPPPVDPEDVVRSLEVIDAARASAREGRVVELAAPAAAPA